MHLPQEDVAIPASHPKLSAPANQFTVQSKVLGNPENRVGCPAELGRAKFLIVSTSKAAETKSSLTPGLCPVVALIVVYLFSWKRRFVVTGNTCGQDMKLYHWREVFSNEVAIGLVGSRLGLGLGLGLG